MLKNKGRYILLPLISLLLLLIFPKYETQAAEIKTGDYTLDKQSTIEDDLYVTGDNVVINGIVDGDVVASGQNILIDGTVTGDLYLFGTTVTVGGQIYGNTLVMGSSVSLVGSLRGNIYALGMMTDVNGNLSGDISALAGTLKLNGTIGDDVRAIAGQIISQASVGGDFLVGTDTYSIEQEDVYGEVITRDVLQERYGIVDKEEFLVSTDDFLGFNIGVTILMFIGMYIVGMVLILLAPVKTLQIEKKIITSWMDLLKSFGIGLLIIFGLPLPLFLLALTFVGAPIAILIFGFLLFLSLFGTIWTESAIGQKILQYTNQKDSLRFLSLLIGRLISSIVRLIPLIGGIYSLALIAITVGAVFRTKYDAYLIAKNNSKKDIKKK